jgi:hypothetical protein
MGSSREERDERRSEAGSRGGANPSLEDLLERLALDAAASHRRPDVLRKQLAIRPELFGSV